MTTFAERLDALPDSTNIGSWREDGVGDPVVLEIDYHALEARLRLAVELLERFLDGEHQSWVKGCPECMTTRDDVRVLVGKIKGELT